jgi:hypothetical protein
MKQRTLTAAKTLLLEFERAGWLKPRIHRHKLKLYDKGDLARCWLPHSQWRAALPRLD